MFKKIAPILLGNLIFISIAVAKAGRFPLSPAVKPLGATELTIYYGDDARFPLKIGPVGSRFWILPVNAYVEFPYYPCLIVMGPDNYNRFTVIIRERNYGCHFNLVIPRPSIGNHNIQFIGYYGQVINTGLSVNVIPHTLSIYPIPDQSAIVNTKFQLNLQNKIAYYDENASSGSLPTIFINAINNSPSLQNLGLFYDPATLTIKGVPNQTGVFEYAISAQNAYSAAQIKILKINVSINPQDTPKFKPNRYLSAAMPGQEFRFNLINLLKQNANYTTSDQINFKLDKSKTQEDAKWLKIDSSGRYLIGIPPNYLAGRTVKVYISAYSSSGGSSEIADINLPIVLDSAMKPTIKKDIIINAKAGSQIYCNLINDIDDPTNDNNLHVFLESVKPAAPWLKISNIVPTVLEGIVPNNTAGVKYIITLKSSNQLGGDSDKEVAYLKIDTNPN